MNDDSSFNVCVCVYEGEKESMSVGGAACDWYKGVRSRCK